jgi:lipopolysaccharide transport protein LptA
VKFFCFIAFFALANVRELPAQTNAPVAPRVPTQISSESWFYDNTARQMIYRGHVHVDDPQMKLTCVWLIADLPQGGGHINHIVAETNVVIDFADDKGQTNHATSDKAVYDYNVQGTVTNETVTLTGRAQVENVQEMLKGEPIVWDRANNHFSAVNETMVFRQNLDNEIIRTNSTAANTNKLSVPK